MATLSELRAKGGGTTLGRGQITRSQGSVAVTPTKDVTKRPSNIEQFKQKATAVGSQTLDLGATATKAAAKFIVNTPKYVYEGVQPFLGATAKTISGTTTADISNNRAKQEQLTQQLNSAFETYKAGRMDKENYKRIVSSVSEGFNELGKEANQIESDLRNETNGIAGSAVNTALTILTAGRLQLRQAAGKQAFQAGSREAIEALTKEVATGFEKKLLNVPSFAPLVERNLAYLGKREAQRLAGETAAQYSLREGKNLAVGFLIKRPIFYQTNISDANKIYDSILAGDYDTAVKTAAWMGTQLLRGGPVGAFAQGLGWTKGSLGKLAYGNLSMIDEMSKRIGDGNPTQIARFLNTLKERSPKEFAEAERVFRILQETNLRTTNNNGGRAAAQVIDHYTQHGYNLKNVTPSQLYKDMKRWADADQALQQAIKNGDFKGVDPSDAGKYVVARWDNVARDGIIDTLSKAGKNPEDVRNALREMLNRSGVAWANNNILIQRLEGIIQESTVLNGTVDTKRLKQLIQGIDAGYGMAGVPKQIANKLSKLGYTVISPTGGRITPVIEGVQDTRKLVSSAAKGDTSLYDISTQPHPALQYIGNLFSKAGVSPESANDVANKALSQAVVSNLNQLGVARNIGLNASGDSVTGGRVILSKLQNYIEMKKPSRIGNLFVGNTANASAVTDVRQLTTGEVAEALNITRNEAKEVSRALVKGYQEVPLELRGLGDKVIDTLYSANPLQKYYSRIQSALRYTYNPFFRVQESIETRLLTRTQSSNLVWNKSRNELNAGVQQLDNSGIFTSSFSGEAGQDVVLGRISAALTKGQKRDMAGLAYDLAESRGMTLEQMIARHPDDVEDALRIVVQYPKKGVLASSLARTMNVAFFPSRYNLKVTMLAAELLAKQPPSIQKAFIHSMFQFKNWLKSDEGIQWQAAHADAIQVLQWATPLNSISYTLNLLEKKPESIGQLGLLGGLPLGVISQMLDSQGIITLNTPYVNPKTGDVYPDSIPQSVKARAGVAIGDLLNSMFTYPGRTLGLPGKREAIRELVGKFIEENGEDFDKNINLDKLTPVQQNMVRVLKGDTSDEAIDALYTAPAGNFNGPTLPPLELPIRIPAKEREAITPRRGLPTKASQSKTRTGPKPKKVAQPMPSQIAQ